MFTSSLQLLPRSCWRAPPSSANVQEQVVKNCAVFTQRLKEHGFHIPYGGTNTHLMNLDCALVHGLDGVALSGDQAARILDIAGIVVNRNLPGATNLPGPVRHTHGHALGHPTGLQKEMVELADILSDLLKATMPFSQSGRKGEVRRARVDFTALETAKLAVRETGGTGWDRFPAQPASVTSAFLLYR